MLATIRQRTQERDDYRRAVPLLDDEGHTVWPDVSDNPTVLRQYLFQRGAELDEARERVRALEKLLRELIDNPITDASLGRFVLAVRAALSPTPEASR